MLAIKKKKKSLHGQFYPSFLSLSSVCWQIKRIKFSSEALICCWISCPCATSTWVKGKAFSEEFFFLLSFCLHRVRQTQLMPCFVSLYAVWMYVEEFPWHHWVSGCQVAASLLSKTKHTGWFSWTPSWSPHYVRPNNQVLLRAHVDSHNNQIFSKMHFVTTIFTEITFLQRAVSGHFISYTCIIYCDFIQ